MKKIFCNISIVCVTTIIILFACRRETESAVSNDIILDNVKNYLSKEVSNSIFDSIDFHRNLVYHLKGKAIFVRLPFKGQGDSTNFIMVASTDNKVWEGNYVSIIKTNKEIYLKTGKVVTTSFDKKKVNTHEVGLQFDQSQSRTKALAVLSMNTGMPSSVWLSFVYYIQTQFPSAFNWYFQWDDDGNNGTGSTGGSYNLNEGAAIYFDPEEGDEVILDQKLIDSFPCVKGIIDSISQYANLNKLTQQALLDVFGIGKNIHLSIVVDYNLTKDSVDGDTKVDSAFTNYTPKGIEGLDFFATIRLNPWVLKNSTKEYITSTIIHEAYHAYIDYKFMQYFKHVINVDSNVIKTLFPIYWGVYGGSFTNGATNNNSHNIMASNFIQHMANPMSILTNYAMSPLMKDSIYRSLSWGGLSKTSAWRNKTDTCDIISINKVARDTSLGQGRSFGPFNLGGTCLTNYYISSDSLKLKMPCQ